MKRNLIAAMLGLVWCMLGVAAMLGIPYLFCPDLYHVLRSSLLLTIGVISAWFSLGDIFLLDYVLEKVSRHKQPGQTLTEIFE